jgi:hypothetical protein
MKFYVAPQRNGFRASNGGSLTYTACNLSQLIEQVRFYHPEARFYHISR